MLWSYALIRRKIGKFNILRESAFHLIPWVDIDYLGATLGFNWQKGWSEVTNKENVFNHQEEVELCDHSHDDL